jgi:FkbH-like protein
MDSSGTGKPPFRFAISATMNAEPLEAPLRFWAEDLGVLAEVRFAPFNQPLQTLLDPGSVFGQNVSGLNVLLVRLEDLGHFQAASEPGAKKIQDHIHELCGTARQAGAELAAPILFSLCPPSPAMLGTAGAREFVDETDVWLERNLQETPGVHYLSFHELERLYPVAEPHNPLGEKLGGIAYSELFFCALGTALFRHAHALLSPPYKLIALDCDNTLWRGICGEDGPTGIHLDAPRRALQEFMLEQREDGMLLAMVSKNNEADVLETFARNADMALAVRHFVTWQVNWESKAANLAAIASELKLGLDSFIFVDDNPRESGEVEETLPEVLALTLPADPAGIPEFLRHIWAFDHPVVTEEDRQRSALYQQAQEFGRALRGAESMAHFYDTLALEVPIAPLDPARVSRTAQLTQRTNQFNFTTVRRTEGEVRAAAAHRGWSCLTVDASDRFGDYGQVGVMILAERPEEGALEVDTFLLSCRALGRGVEHHMLRRVGQIARERGFSAVWAPFQPTSKNTPARLFLDNVALTTPEAHEGSNRFRFDTRYLAALDVRPQAAPESPARAERKSSKPTQRRFVDYARIARELSRPEKVLERMRARHEHVVSGGVEERLAGIWRQLLENETVFGQNNFFDLGGHSLQAVLLLLRVKEEFGVELTIDEVYSGSVTLASMAALIEARQLEAANPEEYSALLLEIEQLSDEEVQALLAEHEAEGQGG